MFAYPAPQLLTLRAADAGGAFAIQTSHKYTCRVNPLCNVVRTYAVGALSLRQSGTLLFNVYRFSARSAEKRYTQKNGKYLAAAGKNVAF